MFKYEIVRFCAFWNQGLGWDIYYFKDSSSYLKGGRENPIMWSEYTKKGFQKICLMISYCNLTINYRNYLASIHIWGYHYFVFHGTLVKLLLLLFWHTSLHAFELRLKWIEFWLKTGTCSFKLLFGILLNITGLARWNISFGH